MQLALTILVDGLSYASWLFIVALGLTLVFGVLKILNIAHGSFYALGAYMAASAVALATDWNLPPYWLLWLRPSPSAACCGFFTAGMKCCWCWSPTPCS